MLPLDLNFAYTPVSIALGSRCSVKATEKTRTPIALGWILEKAQKYTSDASLRAGKCPCKAVGNNTSEYDSKRYIVQQEKALQGEV
ncbi:hypothetical protein EW146_g9956 [Bondarzewia mesenterica]|uniref:Uncharacterized protein n=1 Tax=Bondarzewia mesenterica TaxID=1095465 RepID=A0A4S4L1X5_9AGAM|nr:hypothetical protein EW146_g9956 [Bondarzewia mesenterica]